VYAHWDGTLFELGFEVEGRHCNAAGVCHGGMLATLCDMLLAVGANIQARQSRFLPTVSLTCDFMAPARLGDWVEGRLQVHRVTGSLIFASGLLETSGAQAVVRTSGVLKIGGEPDPRFAPERYFS
jgi:uncharacterized protein (TIGR00369 family)